MLVSDLKGVKMLQNIRLTLPMWFSTKESLLDKSFEKQIAGGQPNFYWTPPPFFWISVWA